MIASSPLLRTRLRMWMVALGLPLGAASCFSPPEPVCVFSCAAPPKACPTNYECRGDGYCHKIGTSGACPRYPAPDGAVVLVDAAADAATDAASDAMTDAATDGP